MAPSSEPAPRSRREVSWPAARAAAYELPQPLDTQVVAIEQALGLTLASPITTLTDLPAFDTVSMDGWAVSNSEGPWRLADGSILAGHRPKPLDTGQAVAIATGSMLPKGAVAVLRREHGHVEKDRLTRAAGVAPLAPRHDVRACGEEAPADALVLDAGRILNPPMLGLAAAAGYDAVTVRPTPIVDVFIMGDELLIEGPSGSGRLRDSLGPQVAGWLTSIGARAGVIRHLADNADDATAAIQSSTADLVLTTGGTAKGPVDQLHPALRRASGELVVDQVAVRPGHPMVLARLPDGRPVVGLPGNPLAAAVSFLSLAWPVIEGLCGLPLTGTMSAPILHDVSAPPTAHRLMPSRTAVGGVEPLLHHGPAMLSGLAVADCLAIVPPGGAVAGQQTAVLPLPWCR